MKIAAMGGSLRPQSLAYQVLKLALRKIESHHIDVDLIDLRTMHLPFCSGDLFYPDYPDVERMRERVRSATGLLLATPEYHGSLSGVLKNALDLLQEEQMTGKVMGLIAVVGGTHSTNALNSLRLIGRQLHCWVLPDQLVIPYSEDSFNEWGELRDNLLDQKLNELVQHLIKAAYQLGRH